MGNNQVQRKKAIKFLDVILDENLDWLEHTRTIERKRRKILLYSIEPNNY